MHDHTHIFNQLQTSTHISCIPSCTIFSPSLLLVLPQEPKYTRGYAPIALYVIYRSGAVDSTRCMYPRGLKDGEIDLLFVGQVIYGD
jgi:hypothetical protein